MQLRLKTPPAQTRFVHPIMVLQHDCRRQGSRAGHLAKVSAEQHARYAAAHGYVYQLNLGSYLPLDGSWKGTNYMNKIFTALQATLQELERDPDERVEWIVQMDADTLIIDPAVALHDTLPPSTLDPEPLILGQIDCNGFCNGIIFYKVSHRLAYTLIRILSLEYNCVEPKSSIQPQPQFIDKTPPFDQRATSLTIMNYRDIQERFYRYPLSWFGSYYPILDEFFTGRLEDSAESPDEIRGQLHLAGERKDDWAWEKLLHLAEDVYTEAKERARQADDPGNGLDLMPIRERVLREAQEWWEKTPNGIEGITFGMY